MQKISPSSLELPGESAADGDGEAGSTDAILEDTGVGVPPFLIETCFLSLDAGAREAAAGLGLGERAGVPFSLMESDSDSFGFLLGVLAGFGLAIPFLVIAAGRGLFASGAGRFLPMIGTGLGRF
jgi:hypothetical protein